MGKDRKPRRHAENKADGGDSPVPAGQEKAAVKKAAIAIEGYQVGELVSQDSLSYLFKAKQISMDRPVFLKILSEKSEKAPEKAERFMKEAKAIAQLNSPNIIGGIEVGESGGHHYFSMEYVEGETLAQIIRQNGPFPEWKAVRVIAQAATALELAMQKGICHGDLSPLNIIMTPKNEVKLANLGITPDDAGSGELQLSDEAEPAHKYFFVSPEDIQKQPSDTRSDIYRLGAIFFYSMTGRPPYVGETAQEVMGHHQTSPVPSATQANSRISADSDKLIKKMMAKKQSDRYQNPSELLHDLAPVLKKTTQEIMSGTAKSGAATRAPRQAGTRAPRSSRQTQGADQRTAPAGPATSAPGRPQQAPMFVTAPRSNGALIGVSVSAAIIILALVGVIILKGGSSSSINENEYNRMRSETATLMNEIKDLKQKNSTLSREKSKLEKELSASVRPYKLPEKKNKTDKDKVNPGDGDKPAGDGNKPAGGDKGDKPAGTGETPDNSGVGETPDNSGVGETTDNSGVGETTNDGKGDKPEQPEEAPEIKEADLKKAEEDAQNEEIFASEMKKINYQIASFKFEKALRYLEDLNVFPDRVKEKTDRIANMQKVKDWIIDFLKNNPPILMKDFTELYKDESDMLVGGNNDKLNFKTSAGEISMSWNTFSTENIYNLAKICLKNPTGENYYCLGVFCLEMGLLPESENFLKQAELKEYPEAKNLLTSFTKSAVLLSSNPVGAVAYINDKKVGITPYNVTLDDGEYKITMKKKGYADIETEISLPPPISRHTEVVLKLEKEEKKEEPVVGGGDKPKEEPKQDKPKEPTILFKQPELNISKQLIASLVEGGGDIELVEKTGARTKASKYYYVIKRDGKAIGGAFLGSGRGFVATIVVLVVVDSGRSISGIQVIQHREGRPGGAVGNEFLGWFKGKKANDILKIRNVSGATYTSKGVKKAVQEAMKAAAVAPLF